MGAQSMAEAIRQRDAGMASSAEHAEAVQPGWQDQAFSIISIDRWLPAGSFTMEQVRRWCRDEGLSDPPELRAWGSVTVRLIREGIIEKTGQYAPAVSSNGSAKPLYRRKA